MKKRYNQVPDFWVPDLFFWGDWYTNNPGWGENLEDLGINDLDLGFDLDKSLTGKDEIDHQDHYECFEIQPIDFIEENDLGYHEGNIVKYVSRYDEKGGVEDLEKALWYIKRLIQLKKEEEKQ